MGNQAYSIALCRVSTPEQAKEGHSLERQAASVQAEAERLGAPIKRYWSIDQSTRVGKNAKRIDLKEMLEYCRRDRSVKYLIVDEVDRFMRDVKYLFAFTVRFEEIGMKIRYASNPELNGEGVMAKMMLAMKAAAAEASNEERMTKSVNGLRERVKLGYYPFPAPPGYVKPSRLGQSDMEIKANTGLFVPDEPRFRLLRQAFELVSQGTSLTEACRWLARQGYVTRSGKPMYPNRLREILRNGYYAGFVRVQGWDFVQEDCRHQSMISRTTFERVQAVLDGKTLKEPRKNHNPEYKLSNILGCSECGGKLVGFDHRNGKGWVGSKYRCRSCNVRMYRRSDVHGAISALLARIDVSEALRAKWITLLARVHEEGGADYRLGAQTLAQKRDALAAQRRRYLEAMALNPDMREAFGDLVRETDSKIREVEAESAQLGDSESDLTEFLSFALGFVANLKENWWDLPYEDMQKCKQVLFPAGFFLTAEKKIYTPQISPFFRFRRTKNSHLSVADFGLVEVSEKSLHPIIDEARRLKEVLGAEWEDYKSR